MTFTATGVPSGLVFDERDRPVALVIEQDPVTRERIADAVALKPFATADLLAQVAVALSSRLAAH
jgi:hypothetical protein